MTAQDVDEQFVFRLLKSRNYFTVLDLIDDGAITNDLFSDGYFPFEFLFENRDAYSESGNPEMLRKCVFYLLDRGMKPNPMLLDQIDLEAAVETRTLLYLIVGYHLNFKSIGILHKLVYYGNTRELLENLLALGVDIEERYGRPKGTILEVCFEQNQSFSDLVKFFISYGANCSNIDLKNISTSSTPRLQMPNTLYHLVAHGMKNDFGFSDEELENSRTQIHSLQKSRFVSRARSLCLALSARNLPTLVTMILLEATVEIARFMSWSYRWNFVLLVKQSWIAYANND